MENKAELIARFEAEMARVKRPGVDKLMDYIRKSDFYTAPASTKFHLSCESGLLQHSLNVLDALRGLLDENQVNEDGTEMWFYIVAGHPVIQISDESLIIIALLHDICKTYFYSTSTRNVKNEKTGKWEKVPFYTVNDLMPLGHGPKSAMLVKNYIKLTSEEMYAIWWHMGFTDQNTDTLSLTAAIQKYPIIWALHTADMMASSFMEDKDGNKDGFGWQELGAEDASGSAGQSADDPATPGDSDEPVFMEAAPC
nr:MAG TPA: Putative helicase [Caudoviricetes sp.]